MPRYYVNTQSQPNGDHEVHREDNCRTPAAPQNRQALGEHASCHGAVQAARRYYRQVNGCAHCSPVCHTG